MALVVVVVVVVIGVALARAYGEIDAEFVAQWARAHALVLTDANRAMVHWYLRTARVLRTWGVLAGMFLPPLVVFAAEGRTAPVPVAPIWVFAGYLLGALYAEVSLVRPLPAAGRTAVLASRELHEYLPRRLLLAQRVAAAAVVAAAALARAVPYPDGVARIGASPASLAAAAVGTAIALRRLELWLVRRPQPFVEPSLLAADDVIRSQSAHSVAGSGLAVLLLLLTAPVWQLAGSDVQVLRWALPVPGLLLPLAAFCTCMWFGHRPWRVLRAARAPFTPAAS